MIKHYYFTKEVFEDLEGHGFVYYQVQKFVFDMFMSKELTETAFKIYVLLFDRAKLSAKNGYHDDTGIYVKYTYAELKDKLNVILFMFPIKDKKEFVTAIHTKLWHMQNL